MYVGALAAHGLGTCLAIPALRWRFWATWVYGVCGRLRLIPGDFWAVLSDLGALEVFLWVLTRSNDAADSERFYWSAALRLRRLRALRPEPGDPIGRARSGAFGRRS